MARRLRRELARRARRLKKSCQATALTRHGAVLEGRVCLRRGAGRSRPTGGRSGRGRGQPAPEEVPWESGPQGTDWLADELRLSKGGFLHFWRSYLDPVWIHYIRGPVRIWSVDDGPDEQALGALEARDLGSLNRLIPEPADERLQLREDLDTALARLREVRDKYWDHDWRREHRGYGRYPENELWEAVEGFLDLVDASRPSKPDT